MNGAHTFMSVVNYALPENDYRVQYPRMRPDVRVIFGTPVRPPGVAPDDYVELAFGEGVEWRDLLTFARLAAVLRRRRGEIDLVHFYSTKLVLFGPLIAALARVPSIIIVTGFGRLFSDDMSRYRLARRIYRGVFPIAMALSRAVLFQNRGDLEATVGRLPKLAHKMRYIGSATTAVTPGDRRVENERLWVVHVARLLPSKGVVDFVRVAEALADRAVFVLVGAPSSDYPDMLRLVEDADERGVLTFMGRLGGDELAKLYDSADVMFFPSYGEGMARVMLEAGMRGVCPVAYDIPANRDLVSTGRGFLVPLGDADAARDAITRLAEDRSLLVANAEAYEEHIRREFAMEPFAERLDAVLVETAR